VQRATTRSQRYLFGRLGYTQGPHGWEHAEPTLEQRGEYLIVLTEYFQQLSHPVRRACVLYFQQALNRFVDVGYPEQQFPLLHSLRMGVSRSRLPAKRLLKEALRYINVTDSIHIGNPMKRAEAEQWRVTAAARRLFEDKQNLEMEQRLVANSLAAGPMGLRVLLIMQPENVRMASDPTHWLGEPHQRPHHAPW
jgi:hypothetical protein